MRKALSFVSIYLLLLALTPFSAMATNGAHFFNRTTDSVSDSGQLVITIDEAGVGQQDINYSVTVATATATYACLNNGGNHPQAANKETFSQSLALPLGTFSPINGRVQVTVSLAGTPLSAGDFSCPNGQMLVLASVSYVGVTLTDTTNGVSISLPDANRTFFSI
jgi:hypothetical protein